MNKVKDSNQCIAAAILKLRQNNKLSQDQFAEQLGVSRQAVSRWEMGVSLPNINTLVLISEKFNISLDEIIKGEAAEEKNGYVDVAVRKSKKYGLVFFIIGFWGLIAVPFLAKWLQRTDMETFGTAYTQFYDYIFEYPLLLALLSALLFMGVGTGLLLKK